MELNVTRVEVRHSEQFGDKKVLHVTDGTKWNVAEKKPFYSSITGPGVYEADFDEYKGKPYIKFLRFKGALKPQNQATTGSNAATNGSTAAAYNNGLKERLAADKRRQDDIRLEFYCGLVKDVMIANKKKDVDVDLDKIQEKAYALFKSHNAMLDMAEVAGQTKDDTPMPTALKAEAELAKAKEAEAQDDEEVPF